MEGSIFLFSAQRYVLILKMSTVFFFLYTALYIVRRKLLIENLLNDVIFL